MGCSHETREVGLEVFLQFFFSLLLFLLPKVNLPAEQKVPASQRTSEEVNLLILCRRGLTSGPRPFTAWPSHSGASVCSKTSSKTSPLFTVEAVTTLHFP